MGCINGGILEHLKEGICRPLGRMDFDLIVPRILESEKVQKEKRLRNDGDMPGSEWNLERVMDSSAY